MLFPRPTYMDNIIAAYLSLEPTVKYHMIKAIIIGCLNLGILIGLFAVLTPLFSPCLMISTLAATRTDRSIIVTQEPTSRWNCQHARQLLDNHELDSDVISVFCKAS